MQIGLDSATPPSAAQAAAAKAGGIGMWAVYLAVRLNVGLYRSWTKAEMEIVRVINAHPIAYCSGWDDPVAIKAAAAQLQLRACLDVEGGIRPDGPWVQGWLDASGAGVYGVQSVHTGRRAAFHIAAYYPTPMIDPHADWPAWWTKPSAPCGWQWQNTHQEFGVGVDRSWLEDWFAAPAAEENTRMVLLRSSENGPDGNPLIYAWGASGKRHLTGAEYTAAKAAGIPEQPMAAADLAKIPDAGAVHTSTGTVTGTLTIA